MNNVEIFQTLKTTSSSKDRLEFLKSNANDVIKDIFFRAYNDDVYNIKTVEIVQSTRSASLDSISDWNRFVALLIDLRDRKITGNEARTALSNLLSEFSEEEQQILIGVIQKDLKVGVSRDSFQKIYPIFDIWEVSLAHNLNDVTGVDPIDGTYFASRKLDGCRCVCLLEIDDNHKVSEPKFISRQNKEFTTLDNLKPAVQQFMKGADPGKWVLDGEVCILDEKGDEHFDWIMKEIRRKDHTIENPCYNVFDIITQDVFFGREASANFYIRSKLLEQLNEENAATDRIRVLKQERISSQEDFDRWTKYVADGGWEGFMLRKDVPYKSGRTKDLLKVKKFLDAEYEVIGCEKGTMKFGIETIPVVTNILIVHKGNVVSVGSGISKDQRIAWYDEPENIIGKTVTIQYFEETKDSKTGALSLRFPILKYVYEADRDV